MADKYVKISDIEEYCNTYSAYFQGKEQSVTQAALRRVKEYAIQNAADVQPLSVVAEYVKNRLYETAFNEPDAVARNTIADMAGRIDFWINELKDN